VEDELPAEKSAPMLAQQLAQAEAKIAELESEIAHLRSEQGPPKPASIQPPILVLDSITDAFVAFDKEFRYTWVNAEAARFIGKSREELLGRSVWELFPAVAGTVVEEKLREVLERQQPVEFENNYAPWNRWFYNRAYPTKEGGLAIYWREITEQKRLQEQLRRQALVLEQVHDSIIATDLDGRITQWNRGAEEMFGYEAGEVVGRHAALLYFEEDRAQVGPSIIERLRRDGQREIEMRGRRKSGEECYIRLSLSLLRDEAGQPYGMLGVSTDITAAKQAEKARRENEERYRSLVNAMPHVAYLTDAGGKATMLNEYWEQYTGVPAGQALDFDWLSYVHADDAPGHAASIKSCVEAGECFEREYRLRNAAGEYRWNLARAVPVREADGVITQWVGTSTDIHAQKSAHEALRRSEERFRLASQAVDGIVYDWDPRTGIVQRSGNIEKLLGVTPDEAAATDQWWQERVHPEDAAKSTLNLLSALPPEQNNFETEFRIRHAAGHWIYACERGYIVRDESGVPVRVVGSTQDISERKRLERELEFQANILRATHDAVIALDEKLCIRYCNAAAERAYGVPLSEVIGKPLPAMHGYAWLAPEDEGRCLKDLIERGSWQGEYLHILRDGSQIVVNCTVNVLSPDAGGGMVSVIRDVSARKRVELQVQKHAAQLARANEDLLHFAYAVSHDLQTPLRTVSSFSQLLGLKYKTKLDEEGVEFLNWIVEASARMTAMLRDLLQFTQVAGGEVQFNEDVPLEQPLATALTNLRSALDETGAVIARDPLPTVACDAGQLAQLFQNLVGNCLKYRKPDAAPAIRISAERSAEEWVIGVHDNGIGFDPKHAERIFRVFQRLHGAEFAGTGIGLTICKRIVERRGGRIWAEAKPGEGASFFFSIPDSTEVIQPAPPMNWDRLQTVFADRVVPTEAPAATALFDELFHALDLAQAMVRDMDGIIVVWTSGAERLFGWSKNEAIGRRLHDLLRIEFPKPVAEIEADLLRAGEWTGQLRAFKKDGSPIWLAAHKALYRDGSGRPQSIIEVHNDITLLKEAEAALLRSTEQRELALRAGQMGVWQWDSRTGVVVWDATMEGFLGMAPGSFPGTYEAFHQRIHPDDIADVEASIAEAFESGTEYQIEHRILHADGSYRWWRGQGRVVFEGGQPAGLSGVVWDITRQREQQQDRQFLLDLSSKLTRTADRRQLVDLAVAEICAYLRVSRCSYIEIDSQARLAEVVADHRTAGPSVLGTYPLDAFGEVNADLAKNQVVAVSDTSIDARVAHTYESSYRPLGVRSSIAVPLHRESIWRATISVCDQYPRRWQDREIALLRGVAERLWPALENARLLEEFEGTFEQAAVGMAHVAPDGRWLRLNRRVSSITGYTKEELLAGRFQDITHPDDLETDLEQYTALQRGETPSYSLEKRYFHKNGSIVWTNLTVSMIRNPRGDPEYAISVIEDITDRKKAAQELKESRAIAELRLREIESIYSRAPVGLLFLDKDLRFVRINEYLAKLNGYPVADHIGRTVDEVLPQVAPQLVPIFKQILETRVPLVEAEIRGTLQGKPGQESIFLVSYFPAEAEDGTLLGLNGVVQDITERKRTEAAWLEVSERLWIATSAANLGVFVWDAREDRVYWENQRMYDIAGRTREEGPLDLRDFLEKLIHPGDAAEFEQTRAAAVKRGGSYHQQCRIVRKDGTRWVEISGQFDLGSDGAPLRLTGVLADITDRIEAEQASRDRRQLLLKVLDSLYTFVAVISPDGVLLEANRAPLEAAGIQPVEVIGKFLPDTFWWSYSSQVQSRLWSAIHLAQGGESSRFDIQARMKDGELVTLDWMISPVREDTGEIRYLIASAVSIEERVRMEAALRKGEERYMLAEWATNDGLWDWNPATDECYFSARFKALLGFEAEELEHKATTVFARAHPDDASTLFEAIRQHFDERQPYDIEIRVRMKDGSYRWFRTRGQALRNEAGDVVRMVGSMSDIHQRKQAEALAREQDQQWRHMIDSIEPLAWMADERGDIFWYNRRWYEYTGTTLQQVEGWGWQSVHDPKKLPEVMEQWTASIRTGEPFEMIFPLRGADGVFRSFLTRIAPVRDSNGRVMRWFGTNTNVDTLRKEQDLLKESERKFRELAESLPELVWTADSQGRIVYVNPQWTVYTGVPFEKGLGGGWTLIVHPEDGETLFNRWSDALANEHSYECEARVRRHDGVHRWFLNRAQPVRDEAGSIVRWLGTSTDIHEHKLTEQALRRSNEDLEQFAYAASHDLQEPLRMVTIYTQLLARRYGEQGPDAELFVGYVVDGVRRMDGLLKGLLAYSQAGIDAESSTSLECGPVLNDALANLRRAIAESGAGITCDPLPAVACADSALLALFQNLIGNAIKYRDTSRPLHVHVSAVREGRCVRFSVADNGIGMKTEYLTLIFGVFKRLHKEEYPGVGVGLAICKRIVERQGGRIWAESELGKGTTFYFTLPAGE
jgi:PAS domain S-box-containing protein